MPETHWFAFAGLRWLTRLGLACPWCGQRSFACECGKGGGRSTTTTTVNIPAPTEEERALQRKQVELLELQVREARRQSELLGEVFPQSQALLKEQLSLTQELATFQRAQLVRQESLEKQLLTSLEAQKETPEQQEIRTLSEKRALSILRGEAPVLSPQQESLIETTFKSAEEEAQTSLRQFAEELAASRGLRLTDTPIGAEVLRAGGELTSRLTGAKAASKLEAGQTQQVFQQSVAQFQDALRQQAFQNRLALTARETPGLGLAAAGAPSLLLGAPGVVGAPARMAGSLIERMQAQRFATPTTTTKSLIGGGIGFGDIAQPLATLGAAAIPRLSTVRVKKDIEPLDRGEYERARQAVAKTPVVKFRYTWEGAESRPHLGILIETSPPEVSRDGLHLDVPGYLGLTLAAVKGVDRRVDRFERGLNLKAVA